MRSAGQRDASASAVVRGGGAAAWKGTPDKRQQRYLLSAHRLRRPRVVNVPMPWSRCRARPAPPHLSEHAAIRAPTRRPFGFRGSDPSRIGRAHGIRERRETAMAMRRVTGRKPKKHAEPGGASLAVASGRLWIMPPRGVQGSSSGTGSLNRIAVRNFPSRSRRGSGARGVVTDVSRTGFEPRMEGEAGPSTHPFEPLRGIPCYRRPASRGVIEDGSAPSLFNAAGSSSGPASFLVR